MSEFYLSVDLGGTSLRIALLSADPQILAQRSFSSEYVRDGKDLVPFLKQSILNLLRGEKIPAEKIKGAALGFPGLVDIERGLVLQSPHFPAWNQLEVRAPLQREFPFPIFLDNDANQAALGEAYFGAGQNLQNFLLLTLGTGIGGAVILNRKIFHGDCGFAGEFGHITLNAKGSVGALGIPGTFETLSSQSGLKLRVQEVQSFLKVSPDFPAMLKKQNARTALIFQPKIEMEQVPGKSEIQAFLQLGQDSDLPEQLAALACEGNAFAELIWEEFGQAIARGICSLVHSFGIFRILIGGGLAKAWDFFMPACLEEIPKRTYASLVEKIQIIPAGLCSEAGLIGGVSVVDSFKAT